MTVVPNGWEPEFVGRPDVPPPTADRPLTFGYLGTVTPYLPLDVLFAGWRRARPIRDGGRDLHVHGHLGFFPHERGGAAGASRRAGTSGCATVARSGRPTRPRSTRRPTCWSSASRGEVRDLRQDLRIHGRGQAGGIGAPPGHRRRRCAGGLPAVVPRRPASTRKRGRVVRGRGQGGPRLWTRRRHEAAQTTPRTYTRDATLRPVGDPAARAGRRSPVECQSRQGRLPGAGPHRVRAASSTPHGWPPRAHRSCSSRPTCPSGPGPAAAGRAGAPGRRHRAPGQPHARRAGCCATPRAAPRRRHAHGRRPVTPSRPPGMSPGAVRT